MKNVPSLFIPGPVNVRPEIFEAMSQPMIGHRAPEFSDLYRDVVEGIQSVLQTENRIYLSTSTATGLMESAVRNTVKKRCLNLVCGAFSLRWHQITDACGLESDSVGVDWGNAVKPDDVKMALDEADYDVVTVVHNETSTGVMNPLKSIVETIRENSDALILVDAVSSMSGVNIPVEDWGIDIVLASVQKAWGLPPGFAIMSVSDRALERSKSQPNKGYYFDFEVFEKYHQRAQTPSTASIPHLYGLQRQLELISDEGLMNRFDRHLSMAKRTRSWALEHGFELFSEDPYHSNTLTCIENTLDIDVAGLSSELVNRGYRISNGYGQLKGKTFRIAHMADTSMNELDELLATIDDILET
ncbi:MAG: alanine--glyoxylate aminotransferase family protein [Candidatus Marinimicrobia bacterium]|nr:alanine--glyoxylate aminotransferase family protein [Candidatus Neomarinimicrobiota bacterium]MCF7828940.1 alanine--glyoxylate aminotransferase family protein [Candidatus Neomarinimicrobiota bacterium]MCF7879900.1 alanine--glyoxylate aminotransferase family protein [Candidatus Neomarinimicrobiota bacterium]